MSVVLVILVVTLMEVAAFAIGYACGQDVGWRNARAHAHDACLEWARLALHGHEKWRTQSPATALRRAASLICPERRA